MTCAVTWKVERRHCCGTCGACGLPFEYDMVVRICGNGRELKYPKSTCPKCRASQNNRYHKKLAQRCRSTPDEPRADSHRRMEFTILEIPQVAKIFRTTPQNVRNIERNALRKIREHPELAAAWRQFLMDGGRIPSQEDVGEQLLSYQAEMAGWYDIYEGLLRCQQHAAALECLVEIQKCHKLLENELKQFNKVNRQWAHGHQ